MELEEGKDEGNAGDVGQPEMVRVSPAHRRGPQSGTTGSRRLGHPFACLAEAADGAPAGRPAEAGEGEGDRPVPAKAGVLHLAGETAYDVRVTSDGWRDPKQGPDGLGVGMAIQLSEPVVEGLGSDEGAARGLLDGEQEALHVLEYPETDVGGVVRPLPGRDPLEPGTEDRVLGTELRALKAKASILGQEPGGLPASVDRQGASWKRLSSPAPCAAARPARGRSSDSARRRWLRGAAAGR